MTAVAAPLDLVRTRRANMPLLFSGLLYAASLHYAVTGYLYPVFEYYGFTYTQPGVSEIALGLVLTGAVSLAMPRTLCGPAHIVLLSLYVVVFVPTVVVTLVVSEHSFARYGSALLVFAAVFFLACMVIEDREPEPGAMFHDWLEQALLLAWLVTAVYLVFKFHRIMSFAGVEAIYAQRAASVAATDTVSAYAQTYFINVLTPIMVAIGFARLRSCWLTLGMAGFIIYYMIVASKTAILLPAVMTGLFVALKSPWPVLRCNALYVGLLAVVVAGATLFEESNSVAANLAPFLVMRTLALPGLMFSQYYDLFSAEGFTWWSNVKGFNLVAPTPFLSGHPKWPGLGYIVGDLVYGNVANNHNANFYAADGLAAGGIAGLILIGLLFTAWLKLLDLVSTRWDATLTTLMLAPLAITLTNGQFFTSLLSFGGAFFLVLLWLAPRAPSPPPFR